MKPTLLLAIILPYAASMSVKVQQPMTVCDDGYCRSIDDDVIHERSIEEMALSPRALDPKGYKLNVVVFYDDAFAKEFGAKAQDEVKKIIKGTNDIFGHSSLTPKMQVNVDAIEQAKGNNWTGDDPNPYLAICEKLAKAYKIKDANLYLCIGGKPATWGAGAGGVSMKGTVCDKSIVMRSAYVQYVTQSADTGMDLPKEKMATYTSAVVAHEFGHTLGMDHDFHGQDSTKLKNSPDGKGKCSGIMDYTESTHGWSKCSNAGIQKFLNGLTKNCLIPIGTAGRSTEWSEGKVEGAIPDPNGECKPPLCVVIP